MTRFDAKAVIGAGYGDEGKGLLTDFLAAETKDTIVVRSNGGAQAGHSVVTDDGLRHVFHHIGSGALAGARTHLSRYFVAHPMLFPAEWSALRERGAELSITSDPRTLITTPFDVAVNQALELARGGSRHGSTGLGFGETIERNRHPQFAVTMLDLFRPDLARRLERIRSQWLPARLAALGLRGLPTSIERALDDRALGTRFIDDCERYLERVALCPDRRLQGRGRVLFEGAQGLLLDQDYGAFPHVTRSRTGLANMLDIAAEAGIAHIEVTYVTRCYVTRHGAGPLLGEAAQLDGICMQDATNAPNAWQGCLRVAALDTDALQRAIAHDLTHAQGRGVRVRARLAVTCLDQAVDAFTVVHGARGARLNPVHAAASIAAEAGLELGLEAWGPTRRDVRQVSSKPRTRVQQLTALPTSLELG